MSNRDKENPSSPPSSHSSFPLRSSYPSSHPSIDPTSAYPTPPDRPKKKKKNADNDDDDNYRVDDPTLTPSLLLIQPIPPQSSPPTDDPRLLPLIITPLLPPSTLLITTLLNPRLPQIDSPLPTTPIALPNPTTYPDPTPTTKGTLPPLLPRKPLVKQRQHLGHVELHVLEVEVVLVVLLHLEQVVQLEVQLEQAAVASCTLC